MSNIPIVSTAAVSRVAASNAVFLRFLRCCLRRFFSGDWGDIPPEGSEVNNSDPAGALGAYVFCSDGPPLRVWIKAEAGKIVILFPTEY